MEYKSLHCCALQVWIELKPKEMKEWKSEEQYSKQGERVKEQYTV